MESTVKPFKAEDPAKVAARLARKQKAWDEHLAKQKELHDEEKARRKSMLALHQDGSNDDPHGSNKLPIELRAEQYKAKRLAKQKAIEEREAADKERQAAEEKAKRDKLLHTKLPESSLKSTKAADLKVQIIKEGREAEEKERKKQEEKDKKKQIAMKEAAMMVNMSIKDRESELRSKQPNTLLELSGTEQQASERAARAREEYREQLRANKRKIADSLKNRPSLLQRHDESMATKTASTMALKKVAAVVTSIGKDDDDDDDEWLGGGASKRKSSNNSLGNSTIKSGAVGSHHTMEDEIFSAKDKMILNMD